jgi:hypothetical protein
VPDIVAWVEGARTTVTVRAPVARCAKVSRISCAGAKCSAAADCIPAGETEVETRVQAVDLDALRNAMSAARLRRLDAEMPQLLDMDATLRRAAAAGLVDAVVEVDMTGGAGYAYFATGGAVLGPCRGRALAALLRGRAVMVRIDVESGAPPLVEVWADPQWAGAVAGATAPRRA